MRFPFIVVTAFFLSNCASDPTKIGDLDQDEDGYTSNQGDCDDNNPAVNPGANEIANGIDDDCNGAIDDAGSPDSDDDGDGFTENQGDCNDLLSGVNPDAVEIVESEPGVPQGLDDNCDGLVDIPPTCDSVLTPGDATSFANAIDLCGDYLISASYNHSGTETKNYFNQYGSYQPGNGTYMGMLSSGVATSSSTYDALLGGEYVGPAANHPDPQPSPNDGCGQADPSTVEDYTELTLQLRVPDTAESIIFDFNFMSVEFPEFVCDDYDDTFLAILESSAGSQNISFDSMDRPISINTLFFTVCDPALSSGCTGSQPLLGTPFITQDFFFGESGGGTGWLTTRAPVTPGETITLRFVIFDEGDAIYDSAALIDNVRWGGAVDGPVTVD